MPNYEYRCSECKNLIEVSHSMKESPVIKCDDCGGPVSKIISLCSFNVKNTLLRSRRNDSIMKEKEMRTELRDGFGVHKFTPLSGATTEDVLKDARSSGTYIKDQMAREGEKNTARKKAKLEEWTPKAQKRADKKRAEMKEQKASDAAKKRKINLS